MLNVLVVDDDDIVRTSVAEALEDAGHNVHQATNGEKALALITEWVFDVAVCDVQMPGLGGLALFRQIRRKAPGTSVIFMTAFAKVEDAIGTLQDGAADYVRKPFDPAEFARDVVGPIAERHALRHRFEEVVRAESSVLITGERGTDPGLFARTIHSQSARRNGPLVVVACGSLAQRIFESEDEALSRSRPLFERDTWFRAADGGVLLLKDIDALSMDAQAALLRVLDEPTHQVRVVSTTHEDMSQWAVRGLFLESLLYKLSGRSIDLGAAPGGDRALMISLRRDQTRPR